MTNTVYDVKDDVRVFSKAYALHQSVLSGNGIIKSLWLLYVASTY
jgi:hypothetical protein